MKMKSRRRWLALLMAFIMPAGALPVTAFAEDHIHTEACYAKAGDLLCTISESEGHTHTSECVCPGGEYICGLEETEEQGAHEHTSECACPGGEYICGLKEEEGHTHSEDCYAKGGELICSEGDTQSDSSAIQLASLSADSTVSTVEELKQALADKKSEIGIAGQIVLSEELSIDYDTVFTGTAEDAGFVRDDGYTGTLLSLAGTDSDPAEIKFLNITVDGNSVESANSAVTAAYTELVIDGSVFKNCTAVTKKGAAVYMVNCDAEISGCDFTDNKLNGSRGGYGIAVYAEHGEFTFTDCNFCKNSSDSNVYGSLYVSEGESDGGVVRLNVDNCVFSGNSTQGAAAGISTPYDGIEYNDNRYIEIKNSEFTDNYGDWEAGAILLCYGQVKIDNVKFTGNEGGGQAGAALFYYSDADISNSEFSDNSSSGGCSGAVHIWDSVVNMTDVDICNNTAKYEGGAMCIYATGWDKDADGNYYLLGSEVTFNGGNISNNKTVGPRSETENDDYQSNGGGVFVHTGATFIFNDGTMEGNSSCTKGGAVYVDDQEYTATVENNFAGRFYMNGGMIRGNHADISGAGVYVSDVTGKDYVAQSDRDSAHFVMDGGTIRNNTAGENGGGVFVQYHETPCVFTMSDDAFIFDNKANNDQTYAGDDIYDETNPAQKTVNADYPYREYSDILAENCLITPIAGHAVSDDLMIPFINWYIDEALDDAGNAHRFEDLQSPVPADGKLNATNGLKAIWGGYLLLYDANDGSGRTQYQKKAFYPGENARVSDNMFQAGGKEFIGWNTEADGSGTSYSKDAVLPMNANKILYAQYSNTPIHTGSLTISKTVTGTGTPDADTVFEFNVTKGDTPATGQYSIDGNTAQAIPADGKISIKAGQSALLTELEPGEYTVVETAPAQANYKSTTFSVNGGTAQDGCTATVTVSSATASVAFTNDYKVDDTPTPPTPSEETGNLIVSKVVAGNAGDTNKAFSFTVKLGDNTLSGSYGDMNFVNGTATFTLKHKEKKTAIGLPAGISYEVTESEANQDGYTTSATGASGSIVKNETAAVAFTNTKNSSGGGSNHSNASNHSNDSNKANVSHSPTGSTKSTASATQTGDESNIVLWLALMIISFVAVTGICIYRRKSPNAGHHLQK